MDAARDITERAQLRLAATQKLLIEHMGKCPKCNDAYLTYKDTYHEEESRVGRVWSCGCSYSAVCSHLPFSDWQHSDRQRWIDRAAHDAAHKLVIRCPCCGVESMKPEGTEVDGIGTSSHTQLSCGTRGCTFKPQKIPRSLWGTVKANARYIVLFLIVLASAYTLAVLSKMDFSSIVNVSPTSPTATASGAPSSTTSSSGSDSQSTTSLTTTSESRSATATDSTTDTAKPDVVKKPKPPGPQPTSTATSSDTTSSSSTTSATPPVNKCAALQLADYKSWPKDCQVQRNEEYRKFEDALQKAGVLSTPK